MELNLLVVHYTGMTHSKRYLKFRTFSAGVIAALALEGCVSTSEKSPITDMPVATDSGVIDTEVVTANSEMAEMSSTLILKVSGYKEQSGQIMVAVFNSEAAFDSEGAPFRSANVTVEGPQTPITFGNLPTGDYAFKVFHDANGNGKLDTNGWGMPTEKYAFSMDASDPFSAPEWGESKISLLSGEDVRNVSLD